MLDPTQKIEGLENLPNSPITTVGQAMQELGRALEYPYKVENLEKNPGALPGDGIDFDGKDILELAEEARATIIHQRQLLNRTEFQVSRAKKQEAHWQAKFCQLKLERNKLLAKLRREDDKDEAIEELGVRLHAAEAGNDELRTLLLKRNEPGYQPGLIRTFIRSLW